jgi:hypothetical protein
MCSWRYMRDVVGGSKEEPLGERTPVTAERQTGQATIALTRRTAC